MLFHTHIYTWNQRQHIILETIVRVYVCVYASCYMALFTFSLFFFYIRSISRNDLMHSRHNKRIQSFSLPLFLSVIYIHSFIWINTMVDRRNQISVADKGILTSSVLFSSSFLYCCWFHCLKQSHKRNSIGKWPS